jgi:hypothetical protein
MHRDSTLMDLTAIRGVSYMQRIFKSWLSQTGAQQCKKYRLHCISDGNSNSLYHHHNQL